MIWDSIYLTAEQMKLLDTAAGRFGVSEKELMRSAGEAIYREVIAAVPDGDIAVVCGSGNNGGDGYAAAAMLAEGGRSVTVIASAPPRGESSRFFA